MDSTPESCSSSFAKRTARSSWHQRTRSELLSIYRIVRLYPTTLLWPLLVLGMVLAVGVWGIIHVSKSDERSSRDRAAAVALDAAVWVQQQLAAAINPLLLTAAMVQYNPMYDVVRPLFLGMAPVMLAQAPTKSIRVLELVPHGVIDAVQPLAGNEGMQGFDLFLSPANRDGALKTLVDNTTTLVGPTEFQQGGSGFIIRQPIFVSGVAENETFDIPYPINPACGPPCAYNATTRTALWGFVTSLVDISALTQVPASKLSQLSDLGYHYEVLALNVSLWGPQAAGGSGPSTAPSRVASSASAPAQDPVEAPIKLPNAEWVVRVAPEGGWRAKWVGGLMAGVVAAAVATAALLAAALVAWRRHQLLLEALLPASLIRELRCERLEELGGATIRQQDTPADLLLDLLSSLLAGRAPELGSVLRLRTALLRHRDLYTPINAGSDIKGADLDSEVALALVQQLLGNRRGSLPGPPTPHTPRPPPPPPLTLSVPPPGTFDTLSGGLAFLLSPDCDPEALTGPPPAPSAAAPPSPPTQSVASMSLAPSVVATTAPPGAPHPPPPAAPLSYCGEGPGSTSTIPLTLRRLQFSGPQLLAQGLQGQAMSVLLPSESGMGGRRQVGVRQALAAGGLGLAALFGPRGGLQGEEEAPHSAPIPRRPAPALALAEGQPNAAGGGGATTGTAAASAVMYDSSDVEAVTTDGLHPSASLGRLVNAVQDPSVFGSGGGSGGPTPPPGPATSSWRAGAGRLAAVARRLGGGGSGITRHCSVAASTNTLTCGTASAQIAPSWYDSGFGRLPQPPAAVGTTLSLASAPSTALPPVGISVGALRPASRLSLMLTPPSPRRGVDVSQPRSVSACSSLPPGTSPASQLRERIFREAQNGGQQAGTAAAAGAPGMPQPALCGSMNESMGGGGQGVRSGAVDSAAVLEIAAETAGVDVAGLGVGRRGGVRSEVVVGAGAGCNGAEGEGLGGGEEGEVAAASCMGRPMASVVEEAERLLASSKSWQFDAWALSDATGGHALSALGFYLLSREGLLGRLGLQPITLARLLRTIESGYVSNPYHNATHAADVLQTLHTLLHAGQLTAHYLDPHGLLAAYFIIHDYGHPGLTGDFLVATSDPLAVRYNDRSPLENHHCAAVFGLMAAPALDLLAGWQQTERAAFRKQVIDMVLATDMKQHFSILSHFNTVHRLAAYSQQQHGGQQHPHGGHHHHHHHHPVGHQQGLTQQQQGGQQQHEQHHQQQGSQQGTGTGTSGGGGAASTETGSPVRQHSGTLSGAVAAADARTSTPGRATPSSHPATTALSTTSPGASSTPLLLSSTYPTSSTLPAPACPAPRPVDATERLLSLQVALKCADLGNLGRQRDVYLRWVELLEEEMFRQGDQERARGLPISPLCDRHKLGVSQSQVGFFDFVALPLVHAMTSAFPGTRPLMNAFLDNYNYWRRQSATPTGPTTASEPPAAPATAPPAPPLPPAGPPAPAASAPVSADKCCD